MKISDYVDLISDDESSFLIAADWLEEQGRDYEAECLRQWYLFNVWFYFFNNNLNYTLHYGNGDGDIYGAGYDYGYSDGEGYGASYDYGYGDGASYAYGDGYGTGYGTGHGLDEILLLFFASISQNVLKP
jgi:hypothetical protein